MESQTIARFEQDYLPLFWRLQRLQWENYFENSHHDLCSLDAEIFKLVQASVGTVFPSNRRAEVIKHPHVSRLRNWLDNLLVANRPDQTKDELVKTAEPMVIELMSLRDQLAKNAGYESYVDLVLTSEELDYSELVSFLHRYYHHNLAQAERIMERRRAHRHPHPTSLDDNSLSLSSQVYEFLGQIGYERLEGRIRIVEGAFDCEGLLAPGDTRISVTQDGLFHELGHGIAHSLNAETGVYQTWTAAFQDSMAETIALISDHVLYGEAAASAKRNEELLFHTRCAASALFEFALWKHPTEGVYLYSQYLSTFDESDSGASMWSLDTFRSIDPVFVHNYTVGATVAERTVDYLRRHFGTDYRMWGRWLEEHYFHDGRKRSLQTKLKALGSARI